MLDFRRRGEPGHRIGCAFRHAVPVLGILMGMIALATGGLTASAQQAPRQAQGPAENGGWQTGTPRGAPTPGALSAPGTPPPGALPSGTEAAPAASAVTPARPEPARPENGANTTSVSRTAGNTPASTPPGAQVKLVALLTVDGQHIDQGLVWRIYEDRAPAEKGPAVPKSKLVAEQREASPLVKLPAGDYIVNASFGRANLTRKISLKPGLIATEQFVINAGGLRVSPLIGQGPAPANAVTYQVLSDERDQSGSRTTIMSGARPGLIIRLNAGIYQIVSTYGDANAIVRADVTVEAGKLTEATVRHSAARVAFKLVTRAGGEAIADTQWSIQTPQGEVVKESVGALPSHTLAPGSYTAIAKSAGRAFRRDFAVRDGEASEVEVLVE